MFTIYAETNHGEIIECFTWVRDKASGIACAWKEGPKFGHVFVNVWAVEIN